MMRSPLAPALAAALVLVLAPLPALALTARFIGSYTWTEPDDDIFGGFSGLEVSADGASYTAVSDRATLRWGSIERDPQGRIHRLTTAGTARLHDSEGKVLAPGYRGDSEGLAIDDKGRIFVSFEGLNRVARYDDPDAPAVRLPQLPQADKLRRNLGLEGLAITPDGDLLTLPEDWARSEKSFPLWRLRKDTWSEIGRIPRDDGWAPTGADVGPDNMLYVLERNFLGLRGFASRVRRFPLIGDGIGKGEVVLETTPRRHDNLEGIAVWQDALGIRLTMISDDNFLFIQRTEMVEYRITP